MAILAYDDVMLREPRLLTPGLAPVGNVRINTDHPIGKRCIWAVVPNNRNELVSGRPLTITAEIAIYEGNPCWKFSGGQQVTDNGFVGSWESRLVGKTMFAVASCTGTSGYNAVFGFGAATRAVYLCFSEDDTNDPLALIGRLNTTWSSRGVTPIHNKLLPIWADVLTASSGRVYQYKNPLTLTNDDAGDSPAIIECSIGSVLYTSPSRTYYFNGYISFACILDAPPGLGAQLAENPYQFLIPA